MNATIIPLEEFLKKYELGLLSKEGSLLKAITEYTDQFKQSSPEECRANLEAWKDVMSSANEVMAMFEKKPTRVELLKEIEELKAKVEQPITPILVDFDLEIALAHPERVRTRKGDSVSQLYYFSEAVNYVQKLYCIINGDMHTFSDDGIYSSKVENAEYDLFLLAEQRQCG